MAEIAIIPPTAPADFPPEMADGGPLEMQRSDMPIFFAAAAVTVVWASGLIIGSHAALAVLVAAAFAAAILGVRRPTLGLLGAGALCAMDPVMRAFLMTGNLLRWNTFNYWLLVVMALASPRLLRCNDPHTRLFQGFVLLLLVELGWTKDFSGGACHVLNAMAMFGLMAYFLRVGNNDRALYWLGLLNGVLAAGGCAVMFYEGMPRMDANALAQFPETAIFSACLAVSAAKLHPGGVLLLGLLAVVNGCWVFLTGSRGGMLIALFGLLFLILQIPGKGRRLAVLAVGAAVAAMVLGAFTEFQQRAQQRVTKLFDTNYDMSRRTSGRSELAAAAWDIFLDNPLGVGTGNYASTWAELSQVNERYEFKRGKQVGSHSGWLKTLSENGIPGILLFTAYVASFAVAGMRRGGQAAMMGLLASSSIGVALIASEFQAKAVWFLAAGVTVVLHYTAPVGDLPNANWSTSVSDGNQRISR